MPHQRGRQDVNWKLVLCGLLIQPIPIDSSVKYKDLLCTVLKEQAIILLYGICVCIMKSSSVGKINLCIAKKNG